MRTYLAISALFVVSACSSSNTANSTGAQGGTPGAVTTGGSAGTTMTATGGNANGGMASGMSGAGGTVATPMGGSGGSAGLTAGGSGGGGGDATGGAMGVGGSGGGSAYMIPTVMWPSQACSTMVAALIPTMSKRQKAAQMVMAGNANGQAPTTQETTMQEPGAVFAPGGFVPQGGSSPMSWATFVDSFTTAAAATPLALPILAGADAVHGNNTATGTVIFPHNAGLGCTRDPQLIEQIGQITASEVAATGLNWTFGPMVSVSFDDRWGRVFESFSEDPELTAQLSAAAVMGLQGRGGLGTGMPGIIACAKHWAGDGQATAGTSAKGGVVDRGNVMIDETAMRKYGIAPYLPAIQAGLGSIMVSDATWNGNSMTGSSMLLTDILKTELGFKGFVSTDWNAATEGPAPGIVTAANAGVDMFMQPNDWQGTIDTIEAGVPEPRITDAASRILTVKCQAGLFDHPTRDTALLANVGSADHRMVGRQAVRESMVLLKNDNNVLPLAKTASVWVGGSGADSLSHQCGGWTISWQGSGELTTGTTILQAVTKVVAPAATMDAADVAVVVLSEGPYAEFRGDSQTIDTLPATDFALLTQAKAAGKKVVAIVLSGRPVLITDHVADADAWIAGWLPGTEGDGVADVLFGDYAPTGKLSHSWPKTEAQANVNFGDPGYDPLFMLGAGLSY
ncbi:MAG TPA: glycoside hydrolase family 3 N-terminal domain-containing protein [Polyangiaceae bacterium]|nr:glycoside hydrolase family 3 N-terminal domain-containing protein [Polyangiaceae bacterium]